MGTATAERKKKEATPAGTGVVTGLVGNGDHHALIEAGRIIPSPTNPRKHFDKASQKDLAESIKTYGLIQPVIVMPTADDEKGARWEIVAGERRYRACLEAGLEKVPCIVRAVDAKLIREVQLIENLARKDLNPIEEAEAFLHLTTEGGHTQRDLAKRINCSQAHSGNRIRLLDLPEPWRGRLISQEIPPTHARALVPWAKRDAVLEEVERRVIVRYGESGKWPTEPITVEDFENEIEWAVREKSRSMRKASWEGERDACHFRVKSEDEEALEIQEVNGSQRAFNVELFDRLNKEALQKKKAKQKAEEQAGGSVSKPSAQDRAKEVLEDKVREYLAEFRKKLIIDRLSSAHEKAHWTILVVNGMNGETWLSDDQIEQCLALVETKCVRKKNTGAPGARGRIDYWKSLNAIPEDRWPEFLCEYVKLLLVDMGTSWDADQDNIKAIYEDLLGDLAVDWKLSREFLELYPEAELVEMAIRDFKFKGFRTVLEDMKRESLIDYLLETYPNAKCPKSLLKL